MSEVRLNDFYSDSKLSTPVLAKSDSSNRDVKILCVIIEAFIYAIRSAV